MANLAVLASGSGTNFQAIADALEPTSHRLCCLICDRKRAFALERARRMNIPSYYVSYSGRERAESEREILSILDRYRIDLIALAGFMRLLTPLVVDAYPDRLINIHPSLLPMYPGTDAIAASYRSADDNLGITIHRVDHGMDTGPIIIQKSFRRGGDESLEEIEQRIHELEHRTYPEVVIQLLDHMQSTDRLTADGKRSFK